MGNLSTHFSQHELWCQCCRKGIPHPLLLNNIEFLRCGLGEPMYCNQRGHRAGSCKKHNKEIGGSSGSWHVNRFDPGMRKDHVFYAIDFSHKAMYRGTDLDPLSTARLIEKLGIAVGGIGIYYRAWEVGNEVELTPRFIHYDIGPLVNTNKYPRQWVHIDTRTRPTRANQTNTRGQFYHWLVDHTFCTLLHADIMMLARDNLEGRK